MEPQLRVAPTATNAPAAAPEISRPFIACTEDGGHKRVLTCMGAERDWEIVFADLLPKVSELVLASNVKDYMVLRGVCKPWRAATADPKLVGMDPRFFPWHWEMAKGDERTDDKARFVNNLTDASIKLHIPREYGDVVATAEGLLVLLVVGRELRLFNPVTGAVTDLPNVFPENPRWAIEWNAAGMVYNDGEADPTVVLYVMVGSFREVIMHAKPGDVRWQIVDPSPALSESRLSMRGQFFLPTLEGDLLRYALRPQPHFVCVARQHARHRLSNNSFIRPFLQLACHRAGVMTMQLARDILVVFPSEHVDMVVEVFWVDVIEGSLTLVQQQDLADGDDRRGDYMLPLGSGSDESESDN
uniref:KIB1-4 beta-propeller domain-containing protein n=1 Tax=Aegilops tauschii TaxID=37682 RepID=N1QVJ2_AEGTA